MNIVDDAKTEAVDLTRRGFLSVLAVGGVLSLGLDTGCAGHGATVIRHAERTGDLTPNMYVTIKRTGRVGVEVDKCEFGQGVTTMYSTLVAEELDVPIESIDVHFADGLPEYRTNIGMQLTGGSASTKDGYLPVRQAAASARAMLVAAAAGEWGVSASDCATENGKVVHRAAVAPKATASSPSPPRASPSRASRSSKTSAPSP